MLTNPTIEKLRELNLKVMAQMMSEPDDAILDMSFEDRLAVMVEREWLSRKNRRIKKLLSDAKFAENACLEDVDYGRRKGIDKKTVSQLSTCSYISQKLNIILSGMTGSGKTYLACAFGNSACRLLYSVRYIRMPELLIDIKTAREENRYRRLMQQLKKVKLLIIDDIGLQTYSLEESRDILELAELRYNKGSMILASQIPHDKWYNLFPDPTIADAVMDRIIHNSYVFQLKTEVSMREVVADKKKKEMENSI